MSEGQTASASKHLDASNRGANLGKLLDPQALAGLKGVQLRSRAVVDGVLQGLHKSPHHGSSVEFAEHKVYTPGDEIRHIDWKAYGRLDKVYVKRYEHETNLRAFFVVDASGSMGYGADGMLTKYEYASVLAVSLSHLLLGQQDAVALITFAEAVRSILPPRARVSHLSLVGSALDEQIPHGKTKIIAGLRSLSELSRKRGMIFVLSDMLGDMDAPFTILRQLVGRGNQVTVLQILDGDEITFPFNEMTLFEGLEGPERLLVEPRLVRERYLERLNAHNADLRERCHSSGIAYMLVDTRSAPEHLLLELLTAREAARAGRGRRR